VKLIPVENIHDQELENVLKLSKIDSDLKSNQKSSESLKRALEDPESEDIDLKKAIEESLQEMKKTSGPKERKKKKSSVLGLKDFQATTSKYCLVKFGESMKSRIRWRKPEDAIVQFSTNVNLHNETGILVGKGFGFGGYNSKRKIFTQYSGDAENLNGDLFLKIIQEI